MSVPRGKLFAGQASAARITFYDSSDDVRSYYAIRQGLTGMARRDHHIQAVGRGTYVLISALWEAFCEDLAHEAVRILVAGAHDWTGLPAPLARRIAKEVKADAHELSPWQLTGDGWRNHALERVDRLARTTIFNTPKAAQVNQFFADAVGIGRISDSWMTTFAGEELPGVALDRAIVTRGAIAHGERPRKTLTKKEISLFYQLVSDLVDCTELAVAEHIETVVGTRPWVMGVSCDNPEVADSGFATALVDSK